MKVVTKLILVCSIVSVGFVTAGCDLGTYSKRAEQAAAGYQPAVEPAQNSTADDDATSPAAKK